MALFQSTVVKKYSKAVNPTELKAKWELFSVYFHNATIQENIRNSKEEEFQEGFLCELFVKILGYTINPEPNFNLKTEQKQKAQELKTKINKTGKEIDQMVYELYGLNEEEIKIVDGN